MADTPCVLVVDDFPDACDLLRRLIVRLGYRASCVHGGEAALAAMRGGPACGLVLLDLMMPGMSGVEVLHAMRTDPALTAVPVVVCSAAERDTHWPEVRALGARDYLVKADVRFFDRLQQILAEHVGPPPQTR